jgi:hypothetical protein
MIDGGDDTEYLSASETLNDDNYVPQTAAKIRHTLSLNKEKVAPLATKYEITCFFIIKRIKSMLFFFLVFRWTFWLDSQ